MLPQWCLKDLIHYHKPNKSSYELLLFYLGLVVVLPPFVGNLGQDVIRLLVLIFGIADHHLNHWWLKLRQGPNTRAKLL